MVGVDWKEMKQVGVRMWRPGKSEIPMTRVLWCLCVQWSEALTTAEIDAP
jgi:hypothetical protein